jgi:hypothetical protein
VTWVGKMSAGVKRRREIAGEHSRFRSAKHYGTLEGAPEAPTIIGSRIRDKGLVLLGRFAVMLRRFLLGPQVRGDSLPDCAASREAMTDMQIAIPSLSDHEGYREDPTQLGTIRDLMLEAAARGAWLTLTEIAEPTAFGEASISAQLRHLRKSRHGRYRVEKRRRVLGESEAGRATGLWEYQVLPPEKVLPFHEGGEHAETGY